MINLTLFDDSNKFQYNWDLIEDTGKREKVRTSVQQYQQTFETNRCAAEQLITQDTVAKAKCVYEVKQELSHGQFQDVCQEALGLNRNQASAYVSIHSNVLTGATSEDVMAMVRKMEPCAAHKLLKADESVQQQHVSNFQETGRVPSQRSFNPPTPQQREYMDRQRQQKIHSENYDRNLESAFADSPASPFYDGRTESVVEVSATKTTECSVFPDNEEEEVRPFGKTRFEILSEMVDTMTLVMNLPPSPTADEKYVDAAVGSLMRMCEKFLSTASLNR